MPDAEQGLRQEDVGRVRLLTLARPETRNALDDAAVARLSRALAGAESDRRVRVLVLAGEGPAFCSGLDLSDLSDAATGPMERHQRSAHALGELFRAIVTSPLPVIAAVEGPAVAGGAGLVLAADLAVLARSASIRFSEVRLGFVPALVALLLVRHVGEKGARDLLLRAAAVDAERAVRLGLANEVVEDGAARARALDLAHELTANAPAALATTKRLLASARALALDDGLRLAAEINAAARAGEALREGLAAFAERRAPRWDEG
jgi:methylglutaconyl-CoA hydratase